MRYIIGFLCLIVLQATPADTPVVIWDPTQTVLSHTPSDIAQEIHISQIYQDLGFWYGTQVLSHAAYSQYASQQTMQSEIMYALYTDASGTSGYGNLYPPYYHGTPVPPIMQQWLTGHTEHDIASKTSYNMLFNNRTLHEYTRSLVPYIIPIMYSPQQLAQTFRVNEEMCNVVRRLHNRAQHIALSNMHNELRYHLLERYDTQKALNLFDAYYTSHDVNALQPDATIIDAISEKQNTSRHACIIVEAEPNHHAAWQKQGIRSILHNTLHDIEHRVIHAINTHNSMTSQ